MSDTSTPFVSVIIPVYNDPVRLKTCLQALQEQTYPKDFYEVLVVDNGSDESLEPIVAGFGQVKAAYEPRQGSYAARNKGISRARGAVLAFIDSDCIPALDWIERGVATLLSEPNYSIVGGKVEFFFQDPDHPTAVELYDRMMHFNMKRNIERWNFIGAGNFFTFKRVFEHVGDFDSHLKFGGDQEWSQRVTARGYTLRYADDVRVAHPARYSVKQLCEKIRRIERGFKKKHPQNIPPLTWSYESIMEHFSPLPPVIKIMRLKKIPWRTKMKIIALSFMVKYVQREERWRLKLRGAFLR